MSQRYPGFDFDPATKRAHFDSRVPGTGGQKRRRRTVAAETRGEALKLWRDFVEELEAEKPNEIAPPSAVAAPAPPAAAPPVPTLSEFVDRYFPIICRGLKRSTQVSQGNAIRNRLLPVFGARPLDTITSIAVHDFKVSLRGTYSPAYINDCVRVLKMLLRQAVEREVIAAYPLKQRVKREKEHLLRLEMSDAERHTFLATFDDFARFGADLATTHRRGKVVQSRHFANPRRFGGGLRSDSAAARRYFGRFTWLKPLFVIALETGLRKGDLLALRWSAVDTANGWIRLVMEKTEFEAVIAISIACAAALAECRKRARGSERVFVDERGRPICESRVLRAFAIAKRLAGIGRRCRFHDLRHTFASRLVSRGVDLKVVATALGHTTTEQTERYAKPSELALRKIKAALDMDDVPTITAVSAA
jgi:integrase